MWGRGAVCLFLARKHPRMTSKIQASGNCLFLFCLISKVPSAEGQHHWESTKREALRKHRWRIKKTTSNARWNTEDGESKAVRRVSICLPVRCVTGYRGSRAVTCPNLPPDHATHSPLWAVCPPRPMFLFPNSVSDSRQISEMISG